MAYLMTGEVLLPLTGFLIAMVGSPGPANLSLMAGGAANGVVKTLPFLAGVWAGFLLVVLATSYGFGQMLQTHPTLFAAVKLMGFCYILWLAWRVAQFTVADNSEDEGVSETRTFRFTDGLLVHPLNPKAYVTIVGCMAILAAADENVETGFLILVVAIPLVGVPLTLMWCAGGSALRGFIRNPVWQPRVSMFLAVLMVVSVGWSVLN